MNSMRSDENFTDEEIATWFKKAASAGDREAANKYWEMICGRYQPRLYSLCKKMISTTNLGGYIDPNEAVNDSLLKIYTKIDKYNENLPFDRWFMAVSINCVRDMVRKFYTAKGLVRAKKDKSSMQDDVREIKDNPFEQKEMVIDHLNARTDLIRLFEFFEAIGKRHCIDILDLYFRQGLPDRNIAVFFGELKPSEKNQTKIKNATERIRSRRSACIKEAQIFFRENGD